MTIQFNTDSTINGNQKSQAYFTSLITEELEKFNNHITRIEVHVSDENGEKNGKNDIRCLLEARLKNMKPIAVSDNSDTVEKAVSGALVKIRTSLGKIVDRANEH